MLNLIENAIHHSPAGGEIQVRVEARDDEGIVSVQDQGPGISAIDLRQIFERFYRVDKARTRSHGGAGLGLAIVKTIAETHGGRVDVQSKAGAGSTFTLHVPLAREGQRAR